MAIELSDVKTEFGAFFLDHGQGMKNIRKLLNFKAETSELFTPVVTEDTVLRYSVSELSSVLQGFQTGWTPKGDTTFTPRPIVLNPMKMDLECYPHTLEASWLGFLSSNQASPKEWPFVKWWMMEVLEQLEEDYEMDAIFAGEYVAITPGTASASSEVMDGIKKIINDAITAGTMSTISTGAPDSDPVTWVEQVEAFMRQVDRRYKRKAMTLAMNDTLADRYFQGMREKYNLSYESVQVNKVDGFRNITVKGYASFGSSAKIFCTPKENAIEATKWPNKKPGVEGEDRKVKLWTDFHKGIGFIVHEAVFTNDQDLGV